MEEWREWGFEQYANIFRGNNLLNTYLLLCLMHYFDFEVEHNLKWANATCVAVRLNNVVANGDCSRLCSLLYCVLHEVSKVT